jgi:hypothetical protein
MGRALLIVGWLGTAGWLASGWLGYSMASKNDLSHHMLFALISSFLILFSHCWILFYLVGTGKAVKDAVKEHGLEPELIDETRTFKNRSNPWMMIAMLVVMATFIVGGGVQTGAVGSWVHWTLAYLSIGVQLRTLVIEHQVLASNEKLLRGLDQRLRRAA